MSQLRKKEETEQKQTESEPVLENDVTFEDSPKKMCIRDSVNGDKEKVLTIGRNLLSNAIKYTGKGEIVLSRCV